MSSLKKVQPPQQGYALSANGAGTAKAFVSDHVNDTVNFGSVRSTLPKVVINTEGLVKVTHRSAGTFYAISEENLDILVREAINTVQKTCSFFDGMDSFIPGEKIGLESLEALDVRPSEYTDADLDDLIQYAAQGSIEAQ